MHWTYPYHDRWKQQILQSERTNWQHSIDPSDLDTEILVDKISFMDETIPELILRGRFQRLTSLARDLAHDTTSNLTIYLTNTYDLILKLEGDFLIINDRSTLRHLLKLLSFCDSFQILPKDNLFQLFLSCDLRMLE